MRIVFDTNIFVSALAIPGGRATEAIVRIIEGNDHLVISKVIIQELLEVLSRKFGRDQEALAHVAVFLSEIAELIYPKHRTAVLDDEPDNRILECAVSGHAEMIVTGDRAMLKLGNYEGIKIISLAKYLT